MFWHDYRPVIEPAIAFILLFLVSGRFTQTLLRRVVYAVDPESRPKRFNVPARAARVALAIADIIAWLFAFTITCAFLGQSQVASVTVSLFRFLLDSWPLVLFTLLITYSFSKRGNQLLLSLLGAWYLNVQRKLLDKQQPFDLGNEQMGNISDIQLLHTTFITKTGTTVIRPNAYLMRTAFGFADALGDELEFLKRFSKPNQKQS
ncbi:MAG: hypothetical protein AAGD25_04840 [Cyanobacteria bacterium P01_F01_bin.150]